MRPERWRQIEDLYHAALTKEVAGRAALLDDACAGDHELRREVESLLACDESAARLLETPALDVAAKAMAADHVNDMVGQQIGSYTLISRLGAGGMGEVYLAEDTRLKRKIAIKFLHLKSLTDEQARKRLLREAQAVARLDHPNICAVHEVGEHDGIQFIVMQYVEGETLANRIERQPLDLNETLNIAIQIADALSEAHAQGIIHRDIKPQNVMMNLRGQVKVLDFGLAKTIGRQIWNTQDETQSLLTLPGVIIGTAPYMAPEQIRGEILDARSDIFSFGAVLYEMITGTRPFAGENAGAALAAVLTTEPPPLTRYQRNVPNGLQRIVSKCLEKERAQRYQDTADVSKDLDVLRRSSKTQGAEREFEGRSTENDSASSSTTRYRQSIRLMRSRAALALAVTIIILAIGALTYSGLFRHVPIAGPPNQLRSDRTVNPAAVRLYLDSRYHFQRKNLEDNQAAIKLLEQAVAIDDSFAMAYVDLALMYMDNATLYAPEEKDWQAKAFRAIERAIWLSPDLPEAHLARGIYLWTPFNHFPHKQAVQELKLALDKKPDLEEAHHYLAVIYLHVGLLDKALEELKKTLAINPSNTPARFRIGVLLHDQGKYEEALSNLKTVPAESNSATVIPQIVRTLFNLGKKDEAAALIERGLQDNPNDGGQLASLQAMLLAAAGRQAEAEDKIKQASGRQKGFIHFHHTAYNIASAYALMNKPELAVRFLKSAADDGYPCYPLFDTDPNLRHIRTNPQFIEFMSRLKKQWELFDATL